MNKGFPWRLPLIVLTALAVLGGAGWLLFLAASKEAPARGGAYVEGIAGSPMHLNPLLASFNDADRDLTSLLFSGLTKLERDGAVTPDLATDWAVSADGRSYTFRLRSNVTWHSGQPLTADDVVFTFRLAQNKDLQLDPELAALWSKVKVEKVSDDEVRFSLEQPFAPFTSYTTIGLLPAHLMASVPAKDLASGSYKESPVGTGRFRLKEAAYDHVTLEANPNAYNGRPLLDKLEFRFLKDDQALVTALSTKIVDGGLLRPSVGRDGVERVRQNRELEVRVAPRSNFSVLFLNTKSPLFQEKAVRQAIAYSINQEQLVQDVAGGLGQVAESPIPPGSWAYAPDVKKYPFDPAAATKLLDDNGWKPNSSGVREKDGQVLRFSLFTNEDKGRVAIGEAIVRDLRRVGIQVEISASGASGLMQNFLIPRRYTSLLFGIDPGYDPDPYPLWHSSQGAEDGLNVSSFAQTETDQLLEKARQTSDPEARRQLYERFQQIFAEEMPSIPLYHPLYAYAVNRKVRGIDLGVFYDTSSRFFNIQDWYTETQRIFRP